MSSKAMHFPRWTTASVADAADTRPMELQDLGSHYSTCKGESGRWFAFRCAFDSVHDFLAPRMVTTICLATAAIALIAAFG